MSLSPPIPFLPLPVGTTAGAVSPPLITTANNQSHSSSSSSPFENLKPSILIIILILSITLLVSLSLCLLLRLLNRRCLHPLSSSSTAAASSNRHNNNSRRVSPDSFLLDSLPLFTFSSIHRRSSSSSGDCAVCLSKFEPNDQLRLLPLCCHAFHSACIDTWLISNQSCPLCRSPLHASDSDILKAAALSSSAADDRSGSFRLEIGSISRRQNPAAGSDEVDRRRGGSYSIGSFDYVVDEEELEVITTNVQTQGGHRRSVSENKEEADDDLAAEVGRSSWIKDYVDRLSASMSSRALSFRSSGGFFGGGGSSRRSLEAGGEYEAEEANRYGEEISELFRWFSGV